MAGYEKIGQNEAKRYKHRILAKILIQHEEELKYKNCG